MEAIILILIFVIPIMLCKWAFRGVSYIIGLLLDCLDFIKGSIKKQNRKEV